MHNETLLHIDNSTTNCLMPFAFGLMAEWLRSGLQSRARRFDSGSGLQLPSRPPEMNVAAAADDTAR